MAKKIYGVDLSKKVTPVMVRDAITNCFYKAHENALKQMKKYSPYKENGEFKSMEKSQIKLLVLMAFQKAGENFYKPTKSGLIKVCDRLAEFSRDFRSEKIIKKHYNEIMVLINTIGKKK